MSAQVLTIAVVLFVYITIGFITAFFLKRNDIADVMWGPGIFLSALTAYITSGGGPYVPLLIVFFWALRISIHIGKRFISKKKEDFRYALWRKTWKHFYVRSFFQVFLLQGALMFLVSSSVVFAKLQYIETMSSMFWIGILVAVFALLFETIADMQLTHFLTQKTGGIMQTGLWKYSRHPNYFGEVLFWWGIFITTLSYSHTVSVTLLLFVSPLTITFLILYVSGIPMLEKKYKDNQEFQTYASKTNAFFPWFPNDSKK
jgi:steroid 5-alpha reductase family enzyme